MYTISKFNNGSNLYGFFIQRNKVSEIIKINTLPKLKKYLLSVGELRHNVLNKKDCLELRMQNFERDGICEVQTYDSLLIVSKN